MNYPTHDTEWAVSTKGNTWRRLRGIPLIVGQRQDGTWWARRGDEFLKGSFDSKWDAMNATENDLEGNNSSENYDEKWWR